jgi:hypothetical protein
VQFRLETQYGSSTAGAPVADDLFADDLVAYLAWCRSLDRQRSDRARVRHR